MWGGRGRGQDQSILPKSSFKQVCLSSFVRVTKWDRIVFTTSRQVNLAKGPQITLFYAFLYSFTGEYGVGNLGVGWEREGTRPIYFTKVQLQNRFVFKFSCWGYQVGQDCIYHFQTGKPGKRTSNSTMRSYIHSLGE